MPAFFWNSMRAFWVKVAKLSVVPCFARARAARPAFWEDEEELQLLHVSARHAEGEVPGKDEGGRSGRGRGDARDSCLGAEGVQLGSERSDQGLEGCRRGFGWLDRDCARTWRDPI